MYTRFLKISLVIPVLLSIFLFIFGMLPIIMHFTVINKTVPDMTALVTLRVKPLGDNDSMPLVQVQCQKTGLKLLKHTGLKIIERLAYTTKCSGPLKLFSNMKHYVPPRNNTGIINYPKFYNCIKIRTSTGNLSGTGPGKSDYTSKIVTQKTVPDTTALVTPRDKPLGDNDSMPLVQVRYPMRCSQNRICGFGSIVSGPGYQYLSLIFKVKQTMSCFNPNDCTNDTLLCCADWECGSGSNNLVIFFISTICNSVKIQQLKSNIISCRVPNRTSPRTGPLLTGSGSGYLFITGSGSNNHTYKKLPNISKKNVSAVLSLYRLRHPPKSAGYIRLRPLILNSALLKVQLALDCGSGSDYSVFFIGISPSRNMCLGNRDSLNFLNLQVRDLDCGSGSDYSVFFIGIGSNCNMCLGNRDSLNFLNLQVRDLDCGSGSEYMVFLTPKLRYSLTVQLLLSYFVFLKVQMSRDCGSGYEYSVFFTGWGPNSNNCIGNRDSLNFLNLQIQDLDCGSGSDCIVFFIWRLCYSLQGFFIVCGPVLLRLPR